MKRTKKILVSLLLVVGIGAIVALGTRAFFSDSETSTGNLLQAGAVDLKVDSECHYFQNGKDIGCDGFGTWTSTDLTDEKFFNFLDVKPGDWGENTISLTVEDNDAYACMYIENAENAENDLIDPEEEADDTTEDVGELAANLHFTAWLDQGETAGWQGKCLEENGALDALVDQEQKCDKGEGDNKWDGLPYEPLLFSNESGPATDVLDGKVYPLGELIGLQTNYIGVLWCAGDLTIEDNTIECDGATMGNESQTDSLTADLRFYVEQTRNNPDFTCPAIKRTVFVLDEQATGANLGYNEENKTNNWPYVEWDPITGSEIKFTFHNPTGIVQPFYFDYLVDGVGVVSYDGITGDIPPSGRLIGVPWEDFYNFVVVGAGETESVTVPGTDEIKVRLRLGPERDYDFNWIIFKAQQL